MTPSVLISWDNLFYENQIIMRIFTRAVFLFCAGIALAASGFSAALAADPELIIESKGWSAYVLSEGSGSVCYMVSKPLKAQGNYSKRGDIFALITHRPSERSKNVFSYITGYTYKPGGDVSVEIDGKKFLLFTQDDTAWAPDPETDQRIAEAIRSGSKMVVKGVSERGTATTDTFSLSGSTAAHDAITKKCGF